MKVILHIGVHSTDSYMLLESLHRSQVILKHLGVHIPSRILYHQKIYQMATGRFGDGSTQNDANLAFINELTDNSTQCRRLILFSQDVMATTNTIFENGLLYGKAAQHISNVFRYFSGFQFELFINISNFASFIPNCFRIMKGVPADRFLCKADIFKLRWSEIVHRLRNSFPTVPIVVFINEDLAIYWEEAMRIMAHVNYKQPLNGTFDMIHKICPPEVKQIMRKYQSQFPRRSLEHSLGVKSAFLNHYVLPDSLEETIEFENWTQDTVERLSMNYQNDIAQIKKIPRVRVLGL